MISVASNCAEVKNTDLRSNMIKNARSISSADQWAINAEVSSIPPPPPPPPPPPLAYYHISTTNTTIIARIQIEINEKKIERIRERDENQMATKLLPLNCKQYGMHVAVIITDGQLTLDDEDDSVEEIG
ncbi:hypothetical protein T4A_3373 [Trichinella pseudospiralis]|uniref:Uncharacterized protein n=1 Tax=Trichinella pseudospiralis TaxID=6337 RepID=A0A0V1EIY4_TRIPS|nr:hypothetical protein T4A_3373 [Trichinella pseudospiralis]